MKLLSGGTNPKRHLLAFALLLCATGGVSAQSERVNLPRRLMTGAEIFAEIEKQTAYKFAYDKSVFDASRTYTLSDNLADVRSILTEMFLDQRVEYMVQNSIVLLTPRLSASSKENQAASQPRTSDTYVPNVPGGVSPAAQPRPEVVTITHEPITMEIEKRREFPQSHSAYTPAGDYLPLYCSSPGYAVKSNMLYTAATLTPNLAFESAAGPRSTIEVSGSYNWQGRENAASDLHKQKVHMIIRSEYRRWLCERFNGHYFGGHLIYSRYNVSGYDVPLLFDKENRYDGHAFGIGATYGYNWAFAGRWSLELSVGLGYMYMDFDKYGCAKCDRQGAAGSKHYFGPTRAGVGLVFLIK